MNLWKPAPQKPAELAKFEFDRSRLRPEFTDITPALLADIRDVVFKLGRATADGVKMLFGPEITLEVSADPSINNIFVFGPTKVIGAGCVGFELPGNNVVLWDAAVSVAQVKSFIVQVDTIALKHGLINDDGSRKQRNARFAEEPRFAVDDVFHTDGIAIPVFPKEVGEDVEITRARAEEMRQEFDHPDELEVYQVGENLNLIRKSGRAYLERRATFAQQVMAKHGLSVDDPAGMAQLSNETVTAIREEIEAAMRQAAS